MLYKITSVTIIAVLITGIIQTNDTLLKTKQELTQAKIELGVQKVKTMEARKMRLIEQLNNPNVACEIAEMYTGIDKNIIKAQASHETGNFTSDIYKEQNNMFGIGIYKNGDKGFEYTSPVHCAMHYSTIIRDDYSNAMNNSDIDNFLSVLELWAADKKYGMKVKRKYYELVRGEE